MSFEHFYGGTSICDFNGSIEGELNGDRVKVDISTGNTLTDLAVVTVIATTAIVALDVVCNSGKLTSRVLEKILK